MIDNDEESTLGSTCAVVLNWKDTRGTTSCIQSLLEIFDPSNIVVVDNESTGDLKARVKQRFPIGIVVIENKENRGFAAGVNLGIRFAKAAGYRYVLALNNDVVFERREILPLFDSARWSGDLGLIAPVIRNLDGSVQSAGSMVSAFTMSVTEISEVGTLVRPDFLTWACVLVRVSVFDVVGLLDERFFMYWEDVDFGLRCRRAGYDLAVVQDASIRHTRSTSHTMAGGRIDRYQALGTVVMARKYGSQWIAGSVVRLGARLIKRVAARRLRNVVQVAIGAWQGLFMKGPAYLVLAPDNRSRPRKY